MTCLQEESSWGVQCFSATLSWSCCWAEHHCSSTGSFRVDSHQCGWCWYARSCQLFISCPCSDCWLFSQRRFCGVDWSGGRLAKKSFLNPFRYLTNSKKICKPSVLSSRFTLSSTLFLLLDVNPTLNTSFFFLSFSPGIFRNSWLVSSLERWVYFVRWLVSAFIAINWLESDVTSCRHMKRLRANCPHPVGISLSLMFW